MLLACAGAAPAQPAEPNKTNGEARLLRFPAIHDRQIVFTYAGDLYTVPSEGGVARRLTSHEGFEMFARFSPDGKWLAFTGQYDGNTEVYLMPAEGGTPKRLTYTATLGRDDISDRMGPNNIVLGWKNDGKHIVVRSRMRSFNDFIGQLYLIPVAGGLPEPLPLPRGGFCSFSADDSKLVYNRVFREFRTWKRYRGGMADDLWVYDFNTKKTDRLTNDPAQDIIPMWSGNKIYFLSDRDARKRMNLYVLDLDNHSTRQLTHFSDFDIKFPSLGKKAIVFEKGGWLYRLDLESEKVHKVPVRIMADHPAARPALVDVSKEVTNYEIAPDGKRALFGARGDVFTVPAANGPTRNLTKTSGVHERNAKWSPDGKWIAYVSDASGEDEIWVAPQDGRGKARRLTDDRDAYKYELYWAPDSKKILWADRKQRLRYVDLATKKVTEVASSKAWEIRDFAWAPDSKWVAYARPEEDVMNNIYLYSLASGKSTPITDGWFNCSSPAFSGDGKYLFFVSDRDFNPTYSRTEWNHSYGNMSRIYFVTLAKDTPSPFKPRSDEVGEEPKPKPKTDPKGPPQPEASDAPLRKKPPRKEEEEDTPPKKKPVKIEPDPKKDPKAKEPKEHKDLKVDLDGIGDRLLSLPIAAAGYRNLQSVGGTLYYIRSGSGRGGSGGSQGLQSYDMSARKETGHGNVGGFEIAANGKKMLVSQDGKYGIIDLPKGKVTIDKPLNLSGLQVRLDRKAEWNQIFNECWRQMRDFFYDPGMHGVDWKALRQRYAPLVAHVNHRADLTYIIGEMIGELNVGHTYVGGGDMPKPKRIPMGLLGAELRRDPQSGYYQVAKVLRGANWDRKLRSPLTEIGVNVKEGDWILAVNDRPTNKLTNISEALIDTAGKQVTLKVNKEPADKGARDVVVVPLSDEADLYYYDWVQDNIKKVSAATGGKVGYLHVPDMMPRGLNEFAKHFYPQLAKKALIVDVRGNGGGNVSPMLIERLRRELVQIRIARNTVPRFDPTSALHGPKVCLVNEFSASDGDLFPFQFKSYRLGKLIGKRTWGGVVGIRGSLPLLDGGYLNKPEFSRFDLAGKEWLIEGHGVDPDIVVDNDPAQEYAGEDQQLERAIKEVMEELKTKEKKLPKVPPYPKK
jgi:tricorn protease